MASKESPHRVACHLDKLLMEHDITLVELSEIVDISVANLSILKNDRAKAIRFSTLTAICDALGAQPGDLFSVTEATRETRSQPTIGKGAHRAAANANRAGPTMHNRHSALPPDLTEV